MKWVGSGNTGVHTFVPLVYKQSQIYSRHTIEEEARTRGYKGSLSYPYVTYDFLVGDYDFSDTQWRHWKKLAASDERLWLKIVERLFSQKGTYWFPARNARLLQRATTGTTRPITDFPLLPSWILRLRELPCLEDTRGFPRKPDDLLRRTPDTESLLDVEPFVHGRLDKESTQTLLDLLGVRSTPTGPERLLACLRALAKSGRPPIAEVEKWYYRLDQMAVTCSTSDFLMIKKAFQSERLILAQDNTWSTAGAVFLGEDAEDVPEAPVIRASVRELSLWRRIGVAERPTVDLAITWLKKLKSGELDQPDSRRVQALLRRYPFRIWEDCGHWLNLAGEWVAVDGLSYALTMQLLVPWAHLHSFVKQKTADLRFLSVEVIASQPFCHIPSLASQMEEGCTPSP